MQPDEASRTAEWQAAFRAMETVRRPARSRLFEDPLSLAFLGSEPGRYVRLAALPVVGGFVRSLVEWRSGGAMSSGIARTRLIDDWLRMAVSEGIRRIVLLGAGYDCRAERMPELENCRIVEIDHPATQAAKKARMRELSDVSYGSVTYLEADLARQDLEDVWSRAELDRTSPVFVLWEGVAHYLRETAVDATLRALSRQCPPGSLLAFTYLHRGLLEGTRTFERAHIPMARVARENEPWIWGLDPEEASVFLRERGFGLLENMGADAYRRMYWKDASRRMTGFGFYYAALARVVAGAESEG